VLSEDQLRKWYAQLVLGLQYLHSNQIMHRDLKSSNVFLTAQGDIQIGDFGLAKVRCPKTQRTTPLRCSLTRQGRCSGEVSFAATDAFPLHRPPATSLCGDPSTDSLMREVATLFRGLAQNRWLW
jgi:serine/threonine protein kinase